MAKLNTSQSIVDYLKSQGQDSSYSAAKTDNKKAVAKADKKVDTKVDTKVDNKADAGSKLLGVDDELYNKTQTPFEASKDVKNADKKNNNALSNLEDLVNTDSIISGSVWDAINSDFSVPGEVREADAYLSSQLEKIQSGKTSYSDQVKNMMDAIMNREKFSYDVDTDPLFQQALASAMNSGKQAMQDTIGQASALTGGYGSTYATTAGNQAYNSFIEDAYDNLPQYYQMAMEAYQMEGDEMYRQFGMLSELDDKEFNRNLTAYDATYQHRNRMYDEAYNMFRDSKNDAFAMANLQLNEHGQLVSDAYNYYNATSDYADKMYEREYNSWADSINMAWKEIEALNTDAWANKNFDESVRQYEKNYAQTEDHFTRNQELQITENQKDRDWKTSEAEKERNFTASENANRAVKSASNSNSSSNGYYASEKQKEEALEAYINGGAEGLVAWGSSQKGGMNKDEIMEYVESQSVPQGTTITKTKNTWNGFLGIGGLTGHIDTNDEYLVEYPGEEPKKVKAADLPESIRSRVDNLKEGKSITW